MTRPALGWQITARDLEMLAALDYAPFTARQLHKLSSTWRMSFGTPRLVRERLLRMNQAKLVTAHCYAILRPGHPEHYYLLTRQGYQLVHGPDSDPPTKGYFSPVALGRQPHQQALSDFIVHTACGADRAGVGFTSVYRENALRLDAAGQSLFPDCSFLLTQNDDQFRFFVEIDNSTERVQSQKATDSIERKIRTYCAYQDLNSATRFRVLFISAQNSRERLRHILDTARQIIRDPNRTLFYGITLAEYVATQLPVTSPRFLDHRGQCQSLIPEVRVASLLSPAVLLASRVPC
jgi:hypothetical protein